MTMIYVKGQFMRITSLVVAAAVAFLSSAAHAYHAGDIVVFHNPTPACRSFDVAQHVNHIVLRLAAANEIHSMGELEHSYLWDQVRAFVYSREGCVLLSSGVEYKIVQSPLLHGSIDYCLIITPSSGFDLSPPDAPKRSPEEIAAAEKKYCFWTMLCEGGKC
jgi:hypothetical protein